jgi:HAD superfamily hydrolase (TIGR01509 family)
MPARAVVFDFNGTLSDDEPILLRIYQELFAEHGRPLAEHEYYAELSGLSEEEIIGRWLGRVDDVLISDRIARYQALVADGSTVYPEVREAVRFAAERVPVAICSGAYAEEIEPVVEAAGLAPYVSALVAADHVTHGKPHPEGYLLAAELLGVPPTSLLAFEDTEAGVASARAAGARVIAITRTLGAERLAGAHELADRVDLALLQRALG